MLPEVPAVQPLHTPRWEKPPEVDLCSEAVRRDDLETVKQIFQRCMHKPNVRPQRFFSSLAIAISQDNVRLTEYLLHEKVCAFGDRHVFQGAVRSRAFEVLEFMLQRGWDINQPIGRNEPPSLR